MMTEFEKNEQAIQALTEILLKELRETIDQMRAENPKLEYNDCLTVFIFRKLATLQLSIYKLKNSTFSPSLS